MRVDPIRIKDIRGRNKSAGIEDINYLLDALDSLAHDMVDVGCASNELMIAAVEAAEPDAQLTNGEALEMLTRKNELARESFRSAVDSWLQSAGGEVSS